MKRWFILAVVLCTVVLALSGGAVPGSAETLIGFTDNDPNFPVGNAFLSPSISWYTSWTQTVASSNTSIGAIVFASAATVQGSGNVWLTNAVGPGTTAANVIASNTFVAPVLTNGQINNFNTAPTTNLFSALSLTPGTYYLVLQDHRTRIGTPLTIGQQIMTTRLH